MQAMLLQKGVRKMIKPGWLLMDNQYTVYVFSNPQLLHNILHARRRYITINCNARKHWFSKESTLKGYGIMWFDKGAIANILSFRRIREKYPVSYDTEGN